MLHTMYISAPTLVQLSYAANKRIKLFHSNNKLIEILFTGFLHFSKRGLISLQHKYLFITLKFHPILLVGNLLLLKIRVLEKHPQNIPGIFWNIHFLSIFELGAFFECLGDYSFQARWHKFFRHLK